MTKVLFVCLGNICRSPMAEFIFKDIIKDKKIENQFFVDSAATSSYNEKYKLCIDPQAQDVLNKNKIPFYNRMSRQLRKEDYNKFDYILAMEEENIKNIFKIIGSDPENKVFKLLDFTKTPRDIIDPWYYGNFDEAFNDIKYGCQEFLEYVLKKSNR